MSERADTETNTPAHDWADDWADADLDVDRAGDVDPELADMVGEPDQSDPPDGAAAAGGDELYYGSVDEFVREYLIGTYRRSINGRSRVWAARWWEFPEAIIRLEALWRAWEHLRLDPTTGMSVWWRDHADHHMAILMDPDGPFAAANPDDTANHAAKGKPLPYEPPPEGLF
ncbi:DUF4913 domain-containing protein [Nocardioides alkalitolerans]|uniref:DUF4913 domain-containing protein n=1 Tax=Nocardioides alkalitolerans TaxID=281714 RepID=UPI0003FD39C3|nr:DUF4913 domain-containing protein [Nocardioides alkalitolerans]